MAEKVIATKEYQNLKKAWLQNGDKAARETAETMLQGAIVTARSMAKNDLLNDKEHGNNIKDRMKKSYDLQKKKYEKVKDLMR